VNSKVTNSRLVYYWTKPDLLVRKKKCLKKSSVKMNEKQSIQILKPPANSEIMDSVVGEAEAYGVWDNVSNTLGTEPKQRS